MLVVFCDANEPEGAKGSRDPTGAAIDRIVDLTMFSTPEIYSESTLYGEEGYDQLLGGPSDKDTVDVLVAMQRQELVNQEVPQAWYIVRIVNVPVVLQRQMPSIQSNDREDHLPARQSRKR